jgi:hypothetical protein
MWAFRAKMTGWFLLGAMASIGIQVALAGKTAPVAAMASCHEDAPEPVQSLPLHHGPANHDCCLLGHLHATTRSHTATVPTLVVYFPFRSLELLDNREVVLTPLYNGDDTSPPGTCFSLRI